MLLLKRTYINTFVHVYILLKADQTKTKVQNLPISFHITQFSKFLVFIVFINPAPSKNAGKESVVPTPPPGHPAVRYGMNMCSSPLS
jgi:hypothetical protein